MEIKKMDNEVINEYPKMNEFNKKDLKKYVPTKWAKIGISSFVFGILMKATKTNALSAFSNEMTVDGGYRVKQPIEYFLEDIGPVVFKVLSIILLITSILLTAIKKYKNKKEKTTKLTNKKMKILYIITVISILISIILNFVYEIYYSI